ncbi:hypothetical protein EST38_g13926, partial [Candolleomyces aberdarensis]
MEKALNRVNTLISTLTNVREYTIEWDESQNCHARLFLSFLQPALQSWHGTLTRLSIHVPLHLLNSFVTVKLPHLTDIHICLSSGNLTRREINIHLDGFLVFLHSLKDTLTGMSIKTTPSSVHLELSRFFRYLGAFPHFRSIALTILFDGAQLSLDPQAFSHFVQKHAATLESLSLKITRCAVHSERVAHKCINWIQTILSSIRAQTAGGSGGGSRLPELQHVAVALRPLKAPLHVISDFLAAHSTTLKSITLMDRALDLPDVCAVLPAFSTTGGSGFAQHGSMPLRSLEMRIDALSPNFLSLMARRLPYLQSLKLDRTQTSGYARNSVGKKDLMTSLFEADDFIEMVSATSAQGRIHLVCPDKQKKISSLIGVDCLVQLLRGGENVFVKKHAATLESLSLKTTRCAVHSERVAPECINWIQTILSSIRAQTAGSGGGSRLPELQHVAVALRPLKAPLHVISDFLAAHSTTLKSITLMDRALNLPDVCAVLPAFSTTGGSALAQHGSMLLRSLELRIDALSPNFLSLMARRLPHLQSLKLDLVDRTQMSG